MMDSLALMKIILESLAAGGGAWVAIRVELRYLRAGLDRAHQRIDAHLSSHSQGH